MEPHHPAIPAATRSCLASRFTASGPFSYITTSIHTVPFDQLAAVHRIVHNYDFTV